MGEGRVDYSMKKTTPVYITECRSKGKIESHTINQISTPLCLWYVARSSLEFTSLEITSLSLSYLHLIIAYITVISIQYLHFDIHTAASSCHPCACPPEPTLFATIVRECIPLQILRSIPRLSS